MSPRAVFACVLLASAWNCAHASQTLNAKSLLESAPSANKDVIELALDALSCHRKLGGPVDRVLGVIDYSRPSTDPRFWVFDLASGNLLFEERVAHGRNSGENIAQRFSNDAGSLMSSLGSFETEGTYIGHNGYSLKLKGLEPGFNDRAEERAIVIHGARYVSEDVARGQGRIGRSFGCPAVRTEVAPALIDAMRERAFVFAYYPDPHWLHESKLLGDCD